MEAEFMLKALSIVLALVGATWSLLAQRMPLETGPDPDRRRRRHYLASYSVTSLSILAFACIGFL